MRGLYDQLITEALAEKLERLDRRFESVVGDLQAAEAGDRIALHLGRIVRQAIGGITEKRRVEDGIALAREILDCVERRLPDAECSGDRPRAPGGVLRSIAGRLPSGDAETIAMPLIPLLDTTLLTNAPGEPRVGSQLLAEIDSADRIDVVMAFIRRSGLAPFIGALRRHCDKGRKVRVLTTTYTGSTEGRALELLRELGAEVCVSYDITTTRLHAKAWLFHRTSGFKTAYVGSSNLTHSAQVDGLEWNVRVSGARNPDVIDKIEAVFEAYWNSGDFVPFEAEQFAANTRFSEAKESQLLLSPIELRLEAFQERLLEQIAISRAQGHHRNLLVAATGTGKTVMAAVDYVRLRAVLPRHRLLFVAHREEILEKSRATFRHALRDPAFGELWVRGERPTKYEHVFASIQSLHATGFVNLDPDHFDVVIVDEFHHAAHHPETKSYWGLLQHLQPRELLGLTATPERSDGLPVLGWFEDRIAAELRLWDAIDQRHLSPFCYFGIHDGLDLREIPWRRGRGYDMEGLSNLYTANDAWARQVVTQVRRRVDDIGAMRALGFCVSVEHARYMARIFSEAGIAATAVWGDSAAEERRAALADLRDGRLRVVFSVDLFNEGIDVPLVDTLLLLRPTDSPTLFLQQLGRGLRKAEIYGKRICTVLDFVGHHRKEFRFDRRFRALLGGTRRDVETQIKGGFPFLPAGCHMELDAVAAGIVLDNLKSATPSNWTAKVDELRALLRQGRDATMFAYLAETGLDLEDIYSGAKSWSELREAAFASTLASGPKETELRRACGRVLHVDDAERLAFYRQFLSAEGPPDLPSLDERGRRYVRMLVASVADRALDKSVSLAAACELLWQHPQVRSELVELFGELGKGIQHMHRPLDARPEVPLQIHARYTRLEILAAFGIGQAAKVAPWQTGVYWAPDARADLLAFTLDKTRGGFSPTTRYRDYAMSRELIHWESQAVTRADSDTGRRYQTHASMGTSILLFARLNNDERAFWFLGPARYISHESERPMGITWRLEHPLPGDIYASFAAAVA